MIRRIVITADDFGASTAVNEAVEEAHCRGVLTAASLMVAGEGVADAVARARRLSTLGVGLHLVLVDGRPVLPPDRIPDLVDADGRFHDNMALAGARFFFSACVRKQLAAEIEAQFAAFAATGLALDHVNAHKHFHLHPTILSLIMQVGGGFGMTAVRAPVEPREIIATVEPMKRGLAERVAAPWARASARRLRRGGLTVPDRVFGLAWTGGITAERLATLVPSIPPGLTEIYTHPATGPYPGSAPGYAYAAELAALCDPNVKAALDGAGMRLGRFADFTGDVER